MNIGFLGLGKLGLPVALAVESKGHKVFGYDVSRKVENFVKLKKIPYKEVWANNLLKKSKLQILNLAELVKKSDIIFVPIQTPHSEEYEGISKIPNTRKDFDYTFLKKGISDISKEIKKQKKKR